jgi:cell division protein FtsN
VRDYAKKTSRPTKNTKKMKTKNNVNGAWPFMLLITGTIFFVGYASYHFVHEKLLANKAAVSIALTATTTIPSPHTKQPQHTQKPTKTAGKVIKTEISDPASNEPKYDFYKILPATTVTIPDQIEPGKTLTPAITPPAAASYALQIAALQTSEDADQVGNALKSLGYTTFIQHYQASDRSTWYHVMVGPFKSLKAAQAAQTKLYAHQTAALLLKMQR